MKKTDAQLEQGYNSFIKILNKYFTGERLEKLLFMYSEYELGGNLMLSPASGNKGFHNAYDGGYIDHIFNVCKNALKVKELFVSAGGKIDFTDDELKIATENNFMAVSLGASRLRTETAGIVAVSLLAC